MKREVLMEQVNEITLCNLEVILMPNGEILCLGKSIGFFNKFKEYLSIKNVRKNENS